MKIAQSMPDSALAELKRLAGDIVAADKPELDLLDQVAVQAADLAARYRESARQELLTQVSERAAALFPDPARDLPARLAESSLYELSRLEALLDQAAEAKDGLSRADTELMAARERGDYAAMAPLALEADTRKSALAAAGAEFEKRLGPATADATAEPASEPVGEATAPDAQTAAPEAPEPAAAPEVLVEGPSVVEHADAADGIAHEPMADEQESNLVELDLHPGTRAERRRIRDLIRQVRSLPDEAS